MNHLYRTPPAYLCLTLVLMLAMIVCLTGCNTVSGAGQDVSNAGAAVSNAAQSIEKKM